MGPPHHTRPAAVVNPKNCGLPCPETGHCARMRSNTFNAGRAAYIVETFRNRLKSKRSGRVTQSERVKCELLEEPRPGIGFEIYLRR